MDVEPVANHFRRDFFALQDGPGQPWRPVLEERHPVEQVRRLARTRLHGRQPVVERAARVPDRDVMAVRHQPADQIESAIELRRDRDDADVRCGTFDFGNDVGRAEILVRRTRLRVKRRARTSQTLERLDLRGSHRPFRAHRALH